MKNSIGVVLYVALLGLVVFFEYRKNDHRGEALLAHNYKIEENIALNELFLDHIKPLESITNKQWGVTVEKREEKIDKKRIPFVSVIPKEKKICIKNSCYKLLGIMKKRNRWSLSLYNKKQKPIIKEFYKFDIIEDSVKITDIENFKITIKELNSTQHWELKMFDINVSKYKPKENK